MTRCVRFTVSRTALHARICPPPLHVGLGRSPRARPSRVRDVAWLSRHPQLTHRHDLRPIKGDAPVPSASTSPRFQSVSFSLNAMPLRAHDTAPTTASAQVLVHEARWRQARSPRHSPTAQLTLSADTVAWWHACLSSPPTSPAAASFFDPMPHQLSRARAASILPAIPSTVLDTTITTTSAGAAVTPAAVVPSYPFPVTHATLRHGGVLPVAPLPFKYSLLRFRMRVAGSVITKTLQKRMRRLVPCVLRRHASPHHLYVIRLHAAAVVMPDAEIILELENALKHLKKFVAVPATESPLPYTRLFSPRFLSFLELPMREDIQVKNPVHTLAVALLQHGLHTESADTLYSQLAQLIDMAVAHERFGRYVLRPIRMHSVCDLLERGGPLFCAHL